MEISSKPPVILCVDDEELPLKLRQEVLSRNGYRVLSAHNGASALRMFKDNKIDLVISDNRLPDLSGLEVTAEMKRLKPEVPIMMLPGLPEPPPRTQADLFIRKSTSQEAFLARVADLLKDRAQNA